MYQELGQNTYLLSADVDIDLDKLDPTILLDFHIIFVTHIYSFSRLLRNQ